MKKKLILSITMVLIIFTSLLPNFMPRVFAGSSLLPSPGIPIINTPSPNTPGTTTPGNTTPGTTTPGSNEQNPQTQGSNSQSEFGDRQSSNSAARTEYQDLTKSVKEAPQLVVDKDGYAEQFGSVNPKESAGMISLVVKFLIKLLFTPIPYALQFVMLIVSTPDNGKYLNGNPLEKSNMKEFYDEAKINWFTIQKAVFGKIPLFNVDFFQVETDGSDANSKLKSSIASWFKTMYIIAQALSLLVLIYTGIRMALATNPEQKANYKNMFKNWVTSFIILFLLRYGIVIILKVTNWLVSLVPESISEKNFETEIINKSLNIFDKYESAWSTLLYAITYVIIVGYEVYFFVKYFKRLLVMGFLVIIAPLITVTYAIDKADDGKAQAFETWRKMFISNALMQPVNALLYAIFVFSASEIALKAPLLAVFFFMGILKGEDVFNKLFNLQKT